MRLEETWPRRRDPRAGISGTHERSDAVPFLAILVAVTAIRIAGLYVSHAELFYDEAQYWAWAQEPAFGYFSKPPLLAWVIAAAGSVCGDSEFCVRLPAPLFHAASSLLVLALASRMFGTRTGYWAGVLYLTMPGISLSSTLISTDVPLLFFWSLGLFALWRFVERPTLWRGLAWGLMVGLGANAKYAMLFQPACLVVYALATSGKRSLLWHPGTLAALAAAALLLVPNALWILNHGNVTVSHTVEDAALYSRFPNIRGLGEFVLAQAAIIGPVPFAWFGVVLLALPRYLADARHRFLFFLSMPIFLLFDVQALIAKANGNWAATAFPALAILVTAVMVERKARRSAVATLLIAGVCLAAMTASGTLVGRVRTEPFAGELAKLSGWSDVARDVQRIATGRRIGSVVFIGRPLSASMAYYLRDSGLRMQAYAQRGEPPQDHFEMTRPWYPGDPGPVLLVSPAIQPPSEIAAGRIVGQTCFETTARSFRGSGQLCAFHID